MMKSIFKTFFLSLCMIANVSFAYAQTASILPPAKTTFVDQNGKPLVSGTVDFYIPSTTTRKTTWQDAAETIPNTNPVVLDSAGRALILGSGSYRQVVKDRNGNIIWDQVTTSAGTGSGGSVATGDGDLVGTVKPWAGMVAPNQYMFTYGQEISRTTYSALFTAITSSQAVFCNSGSPILNGLSDTTNFWIGMTVELSCVGAGNTTIIGKTATTLTMAANANVTVNTTATFFPWGRGNGATTFNLPDFRGQVLAGNNNMGGIASTNLSVAYFGSTDPNSTGALGGSQFHTITATESAVLSYTVNLNASGTQTTFGTISAVPQGTGSTNNTWLSSNTANLASNPTYTVTTNAGGNPHSIVQPTKTTNYIIKVTPDANSSTASGVTSLGGMTGSIACLSPLTCTGNNLGLPNPLPIVNGGTGQTTSPLARTNLGLNIDQFTGHGDSIYTILPTDRTVGTNAAFTASRAWTLPAANAVNPGQEITIADFQGTVTPTNTIVITRAGSDTINGGTTVTIAAANGGYILKSDGISKWTAQATGAAATTGVTSVTCGPGLSGGTITTSGTCAVSLSALTNSIAANVSLNNTALYFDGPTVAQGTSGTWWASGTVSLIDSGAQNTFYCKLWDGTTVIASGESTSGIGSAVPTMSLSGFLASPAGNIRISCRDITATGAIVANTSGNLKDSTISVHRIQ